MFGIIDIWFVWKLMGDIYVIDYLNVSWMMLFNIYDLDWD